MPFCTQLDKKTIATNKAMVASTLIDIFIVISFKCSLKIRKFPPILTPQNHNQADFAAKCFGADDIPIAMMVEQDQGRAEPPIRLWAGFLSVLYCFNNLSY
jgi:hypothetical protein